MNSVSNKVTYTFFVLNKLSFWFTGKFQTDWSKIYLKSFLRTRDVFRIQSNIYDGNFSQRCLAATKAIDFFHKNTPIFIKILYHRPFVGL